MKFLFFLIMLGFCGFGGFGQDHKEKDSIKNEVFTYVEVMPEFPGGQAAMMKFINRNLRYPPEARENGIEGKVVVQFVVSDKGRISDVQVLHDIGGGCGQEVVHVIRSMPLWKPGTQNNVPVNVYYKLPVSFLLGEEAEANSNAQFAGGDAMFKKYVHRHLKYPKAARRNHITGDLVVNVHIDAQGALKNFSFENSLGYGCEEAVSRLIKSVKHWYPAHKNGRTVDGICKLKFPFPPQ